MVPSKTGYRFSSLFWLQLAVGICVTLGVLAAWRLVSVDLCGEIIRYGGYWSIACCFVGLVALVMRRVSRQGLSIWTVRARKHMLGICIILFAGTFIQTHEPHENKILFDEFALSGVAYSMHYYREAVFPTRGHYINGRVTALSFQPDKRPFFYSFLVSILHDAIGYSTRNPFRLNIILGYAFFALLYAYGCRLGSHRIGILLVTIMAGVPLLSQVATSGGYDLLNLCMMLAMLHAVLTYLSCTGPGSMAMMALTFVLFAQVRYESILYVLLLPGIFLLKWWRVRVVRLSWITVTAPAFLLMPLVINKFFMAYPVYRENGEGVAFFSGKYFVPNLQHAIYYLFQCDLLSTNSLFLSLLGLCALVLFIVNGVSTAIKLRVWPKNEDLVLAGVWGVIVVNTIIMLCNFWGHWDDPMVSRFSLPLQLGFLLTIAHVAVKFAGKRPWLWVPLLWVLLLRSVLFATPSAAEANATKDIAVGAEYVWLQKQLLSYDPARTLTFSAGGDIGLITWGYPSTDLFFLSAAKWKVKVIFDEKIYDTFLVFQRFYVDPQTRQLMPAPRHETPKGYRLETVAELHPRFDIVTRLSKIVAISGEGAEPPAEFVKLGPPYKDGYTEFRRLMQALP